MIHDEVHYAPGNNCANVKLTNLSLDTDEIGYYLSAKYRVEDYNSVRELDIPKIRFRVSNNMVQIRRTGELYPQVQIDMGLGWMPVIHDGSDNEVYFTETVIEEKTHEMTLEEIEKKLGYKVKIVNKKGDI